MPGEDIRQRFRRPVNDPVTLQETRIQGTASFPCTIYEADYETRGTEGPFIVNPHWHNAIEMLYFERGHYLLSVDMNVTEIREEAVCFVNPGSLHNIRTLRDAGESRLLRSARHVPENFFTFKEYGEPVLDQRLLSGTVPQLRVRAFFMNMRAALENQKLLLRQYRQEDNRVSAVKEVMTYVRTNYADRIYLKDLAAIMNMNEQYFCRFFKTLKNSEGTPA